MTAPGRVEAALNTELRGRDDIGAAERAALRAQARAVDIAEHNRDPRSVSVANTCYLELRRQARLVASGAAVGDPFTAFMAGLSAPAVRDPQEP